MHTSGLAPLLVLALLNAQSKPAHGTSILDLVNFTRERVEANYGRVKTTDGCRCYAGNHQSIEFCEDDEDEDHKMWLVTLSDVSCSRATPARSMPLVTTPHGVKLGDPERVLFDREGTDYVRITPEELRRKPEGWLTPEELSRLGDTEYDFHTPQDLVLSVFVRNHRVSAMAAWTSD